MSFTYDKNKTYTMTNDMTDIENYVGYRVPLIKIFVPAFATFDENNVVKYLTFSCVFSNVWKQKGADDIRQLPLELGVVQYTALKQGVVLKQTILIIN